MQDFQIRPALGKRDAARIVPDPAQMAQIMRSVGLVSPKPADLGFVKRLASAGLVGCHSWSGSVAKRPRSRAPASEI